MGYIKILRPANFIFVGICVFFGAMYPTFQLEGYFWRIMAAAFSAMLIAGAGYVVNDYFDLDIDRINKPHRMLPSGMMFPRTALIYGLMLFFCGIILSYFTTSITCILLAFINAVLLYLYARYFKREFVSGNIVVAYTAASTFVYGGVVTGNLEQSLIIAVYAFLYTLMREIIKDMEDRDADAQNGAKTLAIRWQKNSVINLFLVAVVIIILLSGFLYMDMRINNSVLVLLMFFVILPLMIFYRILKTTNKENIYRRISQLMKLDMFILLLIFIIGNNI